MKTKIAKIISSFAMAAVVSLSCIPAQAAQAAEDTYIDSTDITADWNINDYADNLREIYKIDYPEAADAIDNIIDDALNDAGFRAAYEKDGCSVFLSVEETLRYTLDPEASPAIYESNTYYSIYSFPKIQSKSGYGDGAAAAALMALYGCGHYNYFTDKLYDAKQTALIDEIHWDSNKETTIGEITRIIRKYRGSSGTHSFQTKYSSSFSGVLNLLESSLALDATPVIKIPESSGHYYAVVQSIYSEDDVDSITIVDPRTAASKSYTYAEFDALLSPYYYSGIWMSVDVPDNSAQAIAKVKSLYTEGSHFSGDYDDGWQCAGFARRVFFEIKGRKYTFCRPLNRTGFGKQLSSATDSDDWVFDGEDLTALSAKKYLLGLSVGTYVRLEVVNSKNPEYPFHSIAVLETTDDKIIFCDANSDGINTIKYRKLTWSDFAAKYRLLFYVD